MKLVCESRSRHHVAFAQNITTATNKRQNPNLEPASHNVLDFPAFIQHNTGSSAQEIIP